jgi:hypothetical protein
LGEIGNKLVIEGGKKAEAMFCTEKKLNLVGLTLLAIAAIITASIALGWVP